MMKLHINESSYINEDIEAVKKYYPNIDDDTFMDLISLDPTYRGNQSLGKYGKWILNLYNKGKLSDDDINNIADILNQFTTYRNRIANKDLNSYKTVADLEDTLANVVDDDSMLTDRQKVRFLKNAKSGKIKTGKENDYDIVLDTPRFVVYVPNTHEASMMLGRGTKWCTAHENPEWYNNYTDNGGKLYIVKDKTTGERWQYSNTYGDFLNQYDEKFDIIELMQQDAKLSKFFEKFLHIDGYNFDGTWVYNGLYIPEIIKPNIRKLIISDKVVEIPRLAFHNMDIETVIISDGVIRLGEDCFDSCINLQSVQIANSVTDIGNGAFWGCENLMFINIPNSVKYIGDRAFAHSGLESIIIPNSITTFEKYTFYNCVNLQHIQLSNSLRTIPTRLLGGCISLKSVVIPNGVTTIERRAFINCSDLSSVTIPNSVTSIEDDAFSGCYDLTVYTDNEYAIQYCKENNIPVKPINTNESYKLHIKESFSLTEDIEAVKKYYPRIDDDTFMKLISLDPTYRGNDSLGKYGKWLLNLYNKNNLSEDEFEEVPDLLNQFTTYRNRVQNKDLNAYKSLDELSDMLATVIDDDSMLTDRQKVRFLKNVKSGKVQTGKENDYSTDFEDSSWVVWIPHTHEASMKLGKGTKWCTAHENPEWYETYTEEDGEEFNLYIMKNKHTGERYQYCDNPYRGWNYQFMDEDDVEIDEEVFMGDLDDRDFADYLNSMNPDFFKLIQFANDLKIDYDADAVVGTMDYFEPAVVIPDGIRHIFERVFFESDSIRSLYVPESLKTIGELCFADSTLRTIDLDNAYGLSAIEFAAFKYCSDLHDYIFLPNIGAILGDAFAYSGIVGVYIGDSLRVLGNKAFYGCENLKKVEIDGCIGDFSIRTQTFADCPNLTEIYLPKNIQRIESSAFNNHNKDLTIFTDSEWVRDKIESFDINLCNSDGEVIYMARKGFVD